MLPITTVKFKPNLIADLIVLSKRPGAKPGIYPCNCTILDNWVFEKFILTDELFAKDLQIFETFVSVNNNLWGKLV